MTPPATLTPSKSGGKFAASPSKGSAVASLKRKAPLMEPVIEPQHLKKATAAVAQ